MELFSLYLGFEEINKRYIEYSEIKLMYESLLLLLVPHKAFLRTYQRLDVSVAFILTYRRIKKVL
jgi:hypothetical protein